MAFMIDRYFVYYHDDYCGNGGHGLKDFDSEENALEFIDKRMSLQDDPDIADYLLIQGKELKIEPHTVVTKTRVKKE